MVEWTEELFSEARKLVQICHNYKEADSLLVEKLGASLNSFCHARGKYEGTRAHKDLLLPPEDEELESDILKDQEVLSLKERLSSTEKKYKQLLRTKTAQEVVLQYLEENLQPFPRVVQPVRIEDSSELVEESAVLVFSDLHIGEIVRPEETAGLLEYNLDIARDRIAKLVDTTLDITKNKLRGYSFKNLTIAALGDFVSGIIHEELRENAEIQIASQAEFAGYIMAKAIIELSYHFENIDVLCYVGNHGRTKPKYTFKNRANSWDAVACTYAALLCKEQPRIKFSISRSLYGVHRIEGYKFLLMHGDGINMSKAFNLPYYGLDRTSKKLTALEVGIRGEDYDYILCGHFHTPAILPKTGNGSIIMNGSVVGGDEFSLGSMLEATDPIQFIFGVHKEHGMTWNYQLNLKDSPKVGKTRYPYDISGGLIEQDLD